MYRVLIFILLFLIRCEKSELIRPVSIVPPKTTDQLWLVSLDRADFPVVLLADSIYEEEYVVNDSIYIIYRMWDDNDLYLGRIFPAKDKIRFAVIPK